MTRRQIPQRLQRTQQEPEEGKPKREPDYERFQRLGEGLPRGRRREARPLLRMGALMVIILCLA